ncbi:MAG TPA: glycine cleavage system aminomethyltransferase GcvT [Candidatus Tectomicrobia bacterium]|nr:glycine cleavage system aminomethyltransferase GcvT [Candidatus Tectomicrobia bacterium]
MAQQAAIGLKRTPLYELHRTAGAKFVDFGGWEMPVQYSSILDEHKTVRTAVGLFDVSHMGEIEITGPRALEVVQRLTTNDASALEVMQVQYSTLCYPNGGIVDDLTVYRLGPEHFFLCVNAANIEKDYAWIVEQTRGGAEVSNTSAQTAQVALQGRHAQATLQPLCDLSLDTVRYYWAARGRVHGVEALISRTGYTGEDGFEIYCPAAQAPALWSALMEAGAAHGIKPIGLGARDTLRLEMGYALYGNDITAETSPLQAGLGWIVKLNKGDFIGRDALARERAEGVKRRLVGIEMLERGVARAHYRILRDAEVVGEMTSGTMSPSLNKAIGLGYVRTEYAKGGTPLSVDIRGKPAQARVAATPFYPSQVRKV